MKDEDYSDIEKYVLNSGAAPSVDLLRLYFPRWRRQLIENGVERVSILDPLASNLVSGFIHDAMPKAEQDRSAMHEHRNVLWAQGTRMLHDRGWKP